MTPNPIRKVLSTLSTHGVRALLMGGQACVLYGAAEFSRDTDIVILADQNNLRRLRAALRELKADVIAVPPFQRRYLERGHAIHFRCRHPDAYGMRLDVMSVLRGLPGFRTLWSRRTTLVTDDGKIEALSIQDLVCAKKTQRDKDWPMIRRLIEADYEAHTSEKAEDRVSFWIRESRTPGMLLELAARYPERTNHLAGQRPLLSLLPGAAVTDLDAALADEEQFEREADRRYWEPLRRELERMRRRPGGADRGDRAGTAKARKK